MKIVTLVENTSICEGLEAEHGLSLYIEYNDLRILFDMGQSDKFIANAERLGIDLSTVDFAVISHGHYDHGGGIEAFLKVNNKAKIYMSEHAFEEHYNAEEKYIGLDVGFMKNNRIVFIKEKVELSNGITLYTSSSVKRLHNIGAFGLKKKEGGKLLQDDFCHEIYLEIVNSGKRVLFSGCSHGGIIDIMDSFSPDILIGGFHFFKIEDKELLQKYAKDLSQFDTDYYTCHCTGELQYEYMKKYVHRLSYIASGNVIELG